MSAARVSIADKRRALAQSALSEKAVIDFLGLLEVVEQSARNAGLTYSAGVFGDQVEFRLDLSGGRDE